MQIEKIDVLMLQCAYYFVERYHYSFIRTKVVGKEIWLGNPNAEFPVIHLTSANASASYFDKDRVVQVHEAIEQLLRRKEKLLNIHICNEKIVEFDEDFYDTAIFDGQITGVDLLSKFPDFMSAFTTSGNLSRDYFEIARKIDKIGAKDARVQKEKKKSGYFNQIPITTKIIAAICIIIYFFSLYFTRKFDINTSAILLGAFYKEFIFINHDFWRFLTCGFVHVSFGHLLMNMLSLINLGKSIEQVYRWKKFLVILLGSIISGSAFIYVLDRNTITVGLSGGLYGLLAAMLVFLIQSQMIKRPQIMSNVINIVFINLLINLMPNISVLGHLGGFVGGLFLSFLLYPNERLQKMKKHAIVALVIFSCMMTFKCSQIKNLDQIYSGTDLAVVSALKTMPLDFYTDSLYKNLIEYYIKCGLIK